MDTGYPALIPSDVVNITELAGCRIYRQRRHGQHTQYHGYCQEQG